MASIINISSAKADNNSEKIWLSPPHLSGKEIQYIQQAFEQNWITTAGENITEFEKEICRVTGFKYAVALNSGTAAIHLGLILLGIKEGDEVICPTFTFIATANPIVYQKAKPVFIDSEPDTWNICPDLIRKAIIEGIQKRKKPKAIIVVHLYGQPALMDKIYPLSQEFDIPILEDAAEALGSIVSLNHFDKLADISILSFNGNKIITTSGGGALLTNNQSFADKALYLATQAREHFPYYQHSETGYNYRISNISAGIGRGQMEVLEERVKQKRQIHTFYQEAFADLPAISFQPEPVDTFSNKWLTAILINAGYGVTAEQIRYILALRNIESRLVWKPLHLQPVFRDCSFYTENHLAEQFFKSGLCLPSGTQLSEDQLYKIVNIIKSLY
jgi:dTDP-4-amino-4,6-dideoxygalactose transaminase